MDKTYVHWKISKNICISKYIEFQCLTCLKIRESWSSINSMEERTVTNERETRLRWFLTWVFLTSGDREIFASRNFAIPNDFFRLEQIY